MISSTSKEDIKKGGATFTPPDLAMFLAERIVRNFDETSSSISAFDPACGEGELLLALANTAILKQLNVTLAGVDINQDYITIAKERLSEFDCNLLAQDYIKSSIAQGDADLFSERNDDKLSYKKYDLIIANPPYVRTQNIGAEYSQRISKFYDVGGKVDLYFPFIIQMTRDLIPGGILGFISSNRYMSTKSGLSLRRFLDRNFEIIEVFDLGDTKMFDAAVLPAIFIGRKRSKPVSFKNQNTKFVKIYECARPKDTIKVENRIDLLYVDNEHIEHDGKVFLKEKGTLSFPRDREHTWNLISRKKGKWIDAIKSSTTYVLGDFVKVRVGIKTTADRVFIKSNWEEEEFLPEKDLLHQLISQKNLAEWSISAYPKLEVLYPYDLNAKVKTVIDLESYPRAKRYLLSHKETLTKRKYLIDAGRKWYEHWVPQEPSRWLKPKLVFPDISNSPRFNVDLSGKIVNGNCYWIAAEDIDLLFLLQGICNSEIMTEYHDTLFNNKLYSGRRRYISQYVENYPIPSLESSKSQRIIELVKKMNSGAQASDLNKINALNELVLSALT